MEDSFQRYLLSKVTVDDRALNAGVWGKLCEELARRPGPWRVLEIGAGIGTMASRLIDRGLFSQVHYTAIDSNPDNIARARQLRWAPGAEVHWEAIDLFAFIAREAGRQSWDLIIAHAFLDLMVLPSTLDAIRTLGHPDTLHYYTINFDGVTIFEPVLDPVLDAKVIDLYHRTMDERVTAGVVSGDSQTGRHLLGWLSRPPYDLLEAGSSDWVVFPRQGRYSADEQWFLGHLLGFFESSLARRSELAEGELEAWLEARRTQLRRGELCLIVHQMDFLARQSHRALQG